MSFTSNAFFGAYAPVLVNAQSFELWYNSNNGFVDCNYGMLECNEEQIVCL